MAPRPFALVRWVEDPEPSCWQVIKTTQISSDWDKIVEGKAVDANWKKGEETAVAEIIKLGDSKPYLATVMENDLIKPWKQSQLPPKRVSVPKRVPDFVTCTNEEPTTMESQDSIQYKTTQKARKRKSTDSSASPKTPKNQKKDKNNKSKESEAAKAYVSDSESDSEEHEVGGSLATISRVMAEKALARTMLEKQRTSQPVAHEEGEAQKNTYVIDEPKVTVADKSAREKAQNKEHVSSDSETDGKSISPSTSMKNKGCCTFCQREIFALKETLMDTVSEMKNLKKQIRKFKRTSGNHSEQQPESELTQLEKECREMISNSTSVFNSVNLLMRRLFTEEEIISHSVSGKAANSKTLAKPKFNNTKLDLLKSLVIEVHKEVTSSQITCKIQAVQKSVKKAK